MTSHSASMKIALLVAGFWVSVAACASDKPASGDKSAPFATVGKEVITWQDYKKEFDKQYKAKFYHGQPSDQAVAEFQRTVADKLITDALVLNEANRRKIKPDMAFVDQGVKNFERANEKNPQWAEAKAQVLPIVEKQYKNESLVKKLEANIRNIPAPSEAQLRAYYTGHPEKFTAPQEQRVSVILLAVDPSSTPEVWKEATVDAQTLIKRASEGEDFAELAKLYSKDEATADQGGDMGYLHEGMLPGLPQESVNKLKVGEVSEPVRLLEGVGIFKLTDRKRPEPSSFDAVKSRVGELWLAEQSDLAWSNFLAETRKKTAIQSDESKFLPLSGGRKGGGSAVGK